MCKMRNISELMSREIFPERGVGERGVRTCKRSEITTIPWALCSASEKFEYSCELKPKICIWNKRNVQKECSVFLSCRLLQSSLYCPAAHRILRPRLFRRRARDFVLSPPGPMLRQIFQRRRFARWTNIVIALDWLDIRFHIFDCVSSPRDTLARTCSRYMSYVIKNTQLH